MNIFNLLKEAIDLGASDIHITTNSPPIARIKGKLINLSNDIITKEIAKDLTKQIAKKEQFQKIEVMGEVDFSVSLDNGARFRVNAYKQKGDYALAIRVINIIIPSFEELNLPLSISTFTQKNKGLVLVTGPTGSGKSTTLASLIDMINKNRQTHIITLEDPIEYVHNHKKSIVNQREIGSDSKSFQSALRATLRQDPDVILIGEMRDTETISIALTAAETGHLVFSTLHTIGAARTIDRIVDSFPSNQQQQIRTQLSTVCEGIISQQLLLTKDGSKRIAAIEVMICTPAIRNLIKDNKSYQIQNAMQTGLSKGMHTMDQDLIKLYNEGKISKEMALSRCSDYDYVDKSLGRYT